jgi:proteasome activator subunit 4
MDVRSSSVRYLVALIDSPSLVTSLAKEVAERLNKERLERQRDNGLWARHHMSEETARRIAEHLYPLANLLLFSKDPEAMRIAHRSFKYLALINPTFIFPKLLKTCYDALGNEMQAMRQLSCIFVLRYAATPLLTHSIFPDGGQHLIELLRLTVAGIDINDEMKTSGTLCFIGVAANTVPFFDISQSVDLGSLNAHEQACVQATAAFEEWLRAFLDRIFILLENLPQNYGVGKTASNESQTLRIVETVCEMVFAHLSPSLQDVAVKVLASKVNIFPRGLL